ncbi:type II secretion protein F [Cellulomonas carbonis]|nr:type II secretion protein F [Cellulomonas carbonis]
MRGRGGEGAARTSFVAAVGEVAAALRVGASPPTAWARVGVRCDAVPVLEDVTRLGAEPCHAAAVVAATRLAADLGAPPSALLERVALAVARDAEAAAQRRTALAAPRATTTLLTWLPLGGLALGVALGADPLARLLDGGGGTASALAGLVLAIVGRRWSAAVLRSAERAGEEW